MPFMLYTFSAILSLALLALGLLSNSSFEGTTGLDEMIFKVFRPPQTHTGNSRGHVHGNARRRYKFFMILSSKE